MTTARLLSQAEFESDVAPECLVDGLIYEQSTHLLTGAGKAGKSYLAYQLIMCAAEGRPFVGLDVRRTRTLLVSLEMSAGMVRHRMERIAEDIELPMPQVGEQFQIVAPTTSCLQHLDLATSVGIQRLGHLIRESRADLVTLDTLYRFLPGADPLSNEEMGRVFAGLNDLAQSTGAALLILDHVAKGEHLGPVSHSGIGAQVKGGASRVIIGLRRTSKQNGGRWALDVESHFGSWDEPVHYQRPTKDDGSLGYGCVPCGATRAHNLSREATHQLFEKYADRDDSGSLTFQSKRKFGEALKAAGYATGNDQAERIVSSIQRDFCAAEHSDGSEKARPIVNSEGPRKAVRFTWRAGSDEKDAA